MNDRLRQRREQRRRKQRNTRIAVVAGTLVLAGVVALVAVLARGGGDDGPQLSAAAKAGKDAAVRGGCVGCHGRNGEGVTAPSWIGLYGTTITLDDGTQQLVDEAYLVESIMDPKAKKPAGNWPNMPPESMVTPADIQMIVTYIEALATPATNP